MQAETAMERMSFRDKYSWPLGIVIALVLFMGMTVYYVKRAFSERVDLVATDYYYRDKVFSERLAREKKLLAKGGGRMTTAAEGIEIVLPAFFAGKKIQGKVNAYSPLNPADDFSREISFTGDRVQAPLPLKPGQRWRVSFDFTAAGEGYYYEVLLSPR